MVVATERNQSRALAEFGCGDACSPEFRKRITHTSSLMFPLTRRNFVVSLAAGLPIAALVRQAHALSIDALVSSPHTLLALGHVVLPMQLGPEGISAEIASFQRWIAGYRDGAELLHGYGTSTLEFAGPTPATRWAQQLDALDAAARKIDGRRFAALSLERRRGLVEAALVAVKAERLPQLTVAPHVALALLTHFYGGAAASDLCYEARIGKQQCRPLAQSPRKPLPLAPRSA